MCYVVPYKRIDYDMQYVDFDIAILNKADFNNLGDLTVQLTCNIIIN